MTGLEILLVEDDLIDANHVERLLGLMLTDHSLQRVPRLETAISLTREFSFDLALLDLTLPDSNGLSTVTTLHRHTPNLPIVVMTGMQNPELEEKIVDAGAHDFLAKSELTRESLARCIRYLLDRQAAAKLLRRREAELAHLSRRQTMSEMASAVVHELTQPVSVISNLATASLNRLDRDQPEQVEKNLHEIIAESERATDTVRRLRNFFRRSELQRSTVSVGEILREAIRLVERQSRHANVQLCIDLLQSEANINVDPIQIQQVAINLLRNAIDATDAGISDAHIDVAFEEVDGFVVTTVRDNGHGTDEQADSLFSPFYTTRENGIGQGLSISRTIIEAHGGEITAQKNEDRGMTFRFTLPKDDPLLRSSAS
ncbi:MAG: ATP-binding protein [Planctomycetota bacterium]